jgi:superfamily II DNA or RNA helicase
MIVKLGSPISEITFTQADSLKGVVKLGKMLSFTKKVYSGMGNMTFQKISLLENITEDGAKFRTGLWARIQMVAPMIGLPVETLIDTRTTPAVNPKLMKTVALRDYQEKAVADVLAHDMGVLYGATGSGKTYMAAGIIGKRGLRTLFLVHTKDLLYQAKKEFEKILGVKVGVIGDGEFETEAITVATVQTLYKRIEEGMLKEIQDKFDMIIQDETHHIPASTFYEVTGYFSCRYVYGLSATPYRLDGADLFIEAAAGPIVAKISASDLISQGVLSRPVIRFIPLHGETSYSSAPRFAVINKYLVNNEARNREIAALATKYVEEGRTVLVAINQVKHGQNIMKYLPTATLLTGQDDTYTRKKVLDQLRERKVKILVSTLMKEGVDVPSLDVVINAAGGTDTMQLVGRVLRKAEGKDAATIIDFIDNQHVSLQRNSFARMKRLKNESQFTVITG